MPFNKASFLVPTLGVGGFSTFDAIFFKQRLTYDPTYGIDVSGCSAGELSPQFHTSSPEPFQNLSQIFGRLRKGGLLRCLSVNRRPY